MKGLIKSWSLFKKTAEKAEESVSREVAFEESRLSKLAYSGIRKIFGPIVRKLWVAEVEGLHNIPKEGAFILAANHESYFDFICSIAVSPRKIHYLAAEKFFLSKFWKPLMKLTGQIRVDRNAKDKSEVFKHALSALNQGRVIGIFPEGTRSADGKLLKAFTGVGKLALKGKVPIVPVGLIGTYEIMSRHDKFPKLNKAKIRIGEPIHFKDLHDIDHKDHHYQLVTDKVMLKIAELTGEDYPHIKQVDVIEGEISYKK